MEEKFSQRHEVVVAGLGGQGVQIAGELLAEAGNHVYRNVVLSPSYSFVMRGGASTCIVILSQERIASPLLTKAEAVILMESSQIESFQSRVRPGGLLLVEAAGAQGRATRGDIRLLSVPAIETAVKLGGPQAANFVLLGAYLEAVKPVPGKLIEKELEKRFSSNQKALSLNRAALREGQRLAAGHVG